MKLFRIIAAVTVFATLTIPNLARADTIEVKSENVIFVGDVSQEEGKKLVRNLEIYRSTIISLVGLQGRPDQKPLRVYGLKNEGVLGKFTERRGIAGLYKQGLKGPIFVTTTKGGFDSDRWASQVALHEYGHHILHGMSQDDFPRWYDEGFANYLSSFKIEDDIITIGAPTIAHAKSLKDNAWMSPETVFSSILHYPRRRNISQFYGQSWLYVHYMQNHPEIGGKLPEYLNNLKVGQEPLDAFENAFGLTAREFHNLARDYWGENAFPTIQFRADNSLLNPPLTIRQLSEDETTLAFAEGERNFMSKKKAKSLKKTYEKLAQSIGETPAVLIGQAHSAMYLQEYDAAKTFARETLETNPGNPDALSLRGDIYYHELIDDLPDSKPKGAIKTIPSDDRTKAVIEYFEEALAIDPLDYTAVTHLVTLYGRSNLPLTTIGEMAAETMGQSYLKPYLVEAHVDLAFINMRMGQTAEACEYINLAKTLVDAYENKKSNDDFARTIAFEGTYPQCQ